MRMIVMLFIACFSATPLFAQKTLTDGIRDLAAQISASATKEQKHKVAVIPFRELDGQTTVLGTYLAEELVTHLVNAGLNIVERGMLDKLLGEQKLQQSGAIDPDTAKRVGRIAGVDAIVTGSVTDLASMVGVNCRLIETQTGKIFAAAQTKITKDDDVKKIMGVVLTASDDAPVSNRVAKKAQMSEPRYWQHGQLRISVEGLKQTGTTATAFVVAENLGSELMDVHLGPLNLVDENGDLWRGDPKETGWYPRTASVKIAPGTRRRISFTFTGSTGASGTIFALVHEDGRLLLRDLRSQ